VEALLALNPESPTTTFLAVLECVAKYQIFEILAALRPFVADDQGPEATSADAIIDEEKLESTTNR
jgi:hypothetical protein